MSRVIRIDDDVWQALKGRAEPFEDTPNDVLRKLLELGPHQTKEATTMIPKGLTVRSKDNLMSLLKEWRDSGALTIGDVGNFGGKAWIRIEIEGEHFYLNADTTRDGVEEYLRLYESGETIWYVISNARGRANKVTNDPARRPITGFFMFAETLGERAV